MLLQRILHAFSVLALVTGAAALLSGCEQTGSDSAYKAYAPIPKETLDLMAAKGTMKDAPMLIRAYKKEAEFEVWKRKPDGEFVFVKTFPMCRWSGQLGPKKTEGDRQVPEGFYTITPGQMNPNSHYYLSFNVGYPNAYDRANGYSGGSIMVHGICSSAGCFSMTDKQIEEIYAIARESFAGGQHSIQMQSYPFRMTAENLAKLRLDPNMPFWRELKKGSDYFEVTKNETPVGVCNRHYVFGATPKGGRFDAYEECPSVAEDETVKTEVQSKQQHDDAEVAALVAKGVKPVRLVYADGGQNPEFSQKIAEVSRPDALAAGATEIALDEGPKTRSVVVQIAAAKARAKVLLAKGNVVSPVGPAAVASETAAVRVPDPALSQVAHATAAVAGTGPAKIAQAETPAIFDAAPSAYARTEGRDESQSFFKKWLSFGEATKPETAPAVATAPGVASTAPATGAPPPARRSQSARVAKPAAVPPAAPAKPEQLSSALPKEITTAPAQKSDLPKGIMAWLPTFN